MPNAAMTNSKQIAKERDCVKIGCVDSETMSTVVGENIVKHVNFFFWFATLNDTLGDNLILTI